jgi:hypothetical protein
MVLLRLLLLVDMVVRQLQPQERKQGSKALSGHADVTDVLQATPNT